MTPNAKHKPRIEERDFEVTIPTSDGTAIAERIPVKVPMEWDPVLQEWLLTKDAEDMVEATKARHMGLMTPEELVALRKRLGTTQSQIGNLLKIGEKTWCRWESGRQRVSQSMNLWLRALQVGMVSAQDLNWLNQPRIDWSAAMRERLRESRPMVITMDSSWRIIRRDSDVAVSSTAPSRAELPAAA